MGRDIEKDIYQIIETIVGNECRFDNDSVLGNFLDTEERDALLKCINKDNDLCLLPLVPSITVRTLIEVVMKCIDFQRECLTKESDYITNGVQARYDLLRAAQDVGKTLNVGDVLETDENGKLKGIIRPAVVYMVDAVSNEYLNPKDSKTGKVRVCHPAIHPDFADPLIATAEVSAEKGYKPLNWLDDDSPVTVMYCMEAAQRHFKKALKGIDVNTEEKKLDGTPCKAQPLHLAQAAYNLLMACMLLEVKGDKVDDRLFKNGKRK